MLFIKAIKYKNILSSGNQFTEVDFNFTQTTLVKGNSGQGKSLIITALIFGLYGKSNRGTTKKQLVNTVNKKDCLVEVTFTIDGKNYLIKRGISPNIFQIYVNDKLQEELSAVKDQQKYLEQNILKMSYKTFMQVVVLGSNNYIPFMQLSAADRRDLVEEILDIKIFSTMNILLKDKIKSVERKLREIEVNQSSMQDKVLMQENFIQKIKNDGLSLIKNKKEKIKELNEEQVTLTHHQEVLFNTLKEKQEHLFTISFSSKTLKGLLGLDGKIEEKKILLQEEISFFENHSTCPTCKQDLQVDFKNEMIENVKTKLTQVYENHQELLDAIELEENKENTFNLLSKEIANLNSKMSDTQIQYKNITKSIQDLETEIEDIRFKIENQSEEEKNLKSLIKEQSKLSKDHTKCKEALHYFEFSHLLMKDGGIKSKIIQKYLPIINQQINHYLQMMDLYINFTLDEEFKETINTPIHDGFSYSSFSEGEKQRINLATILAWREVSRLKNSANCNLIFFDETLDSSLDASGIDDFLKIINYVIEKSNIFVISHREGFDDRFNRVLEIKKINGFSKILI